jgi:hypothetical protein
MAIFPDVQFIQFDKDVDPSGSRHLVAGGQELDTSITGCLDFGNANTTTVGATSDTTMAIFRVDALNDASGVYNLRFFLNSTTAFGVGNFRFLHRIATHYQGAGFELSLADLDVPLAAPLQNVISTTPSSQPTLSGIIDADVSQYIYLAVWVDADVPFGTYGGCANGSFRYRMLYDFS